MSDLEEDILEEVNTVASGGILVLGAKVTGTGFGFFTQLLMARWLTSSAYGSVVLVISIIGVAEVFTRLGLDSGVVRKTPEYEDSMKGLYGVVYSSLRLGLVAGVVGTVALVLLAPILSNDILNEPQLSTLLPIAAIGIPFSVLGQIAVQIARGLRDAKPYALINQILRPILRFGLIALLLSFGYGSIGAVTGHYAAIGISGIIGIGALYRLLPIGISTEYHSMDRVLLTFSVPLLVVQGMSFIIANTDNLMIGYFLSSEGVGVYNIAFQLRNSLNIMFVAVGYLLPSALAKLEVNDQHTKMNELYQFVTKWIVLMSLPLFFLLFFYPTEVISTLFGAKYTDGGLVLQVLLIGALISAAAGVTRAALIGLDMNRVVMATTIMAAIANIALNIVLIPRYGIVGAAVASTLSVLVIESSNAVVMNRKFGIFPFPHKMMLPAGVVIGMGFIPYILEVILSISSTGLFPLIPLLTLGVVYPAVIFINLDKLEKRLLLKGINILKYRIPW